MKEAAMPPAEPEFRIGTSGYQYRHWRGVFYPENLARSEWFNHYTSEFDTVEINNTFYNLPAAETFDRWREAAPPGFRYILKFSRYGSHLKKLKEPEDSIGAFLAAAEHLKSYLGPVLVQLPPRWRVNAGRLAAFLDAAPRRLRWAFEFRDKSWLTEEVYALLRERNAALCIHDMIADHPHEITADWVYFRFHGDHYYGSYSPQALAASARRIGAHLGEGRDVYAFFNNDADGNAVLNARDLKRYVTS
jgi:uncharacterized protein YecE (DUF72 family)